MSKKLKFKPVITRVKLNPEQAVLGCPGYNIAFHRTDDLRDVTGWPWCTVDRMFGADTVYGRDALVSS